MHRFLRFRPHGFGIHRDSSEVPPDTPLAKGVSIREIEAVVKDF